MDNFMDKLAQKFNAQELIKANSQAEAEEMKKLQLQARMTDESAPPQAEDIWKFMMELLHRMEED